VAKEDKGNLLIWGTILIGAFVIALIVGNKQEAEAEQK